MKSLERPWMGAKIKGFHHKLLIYKEIKNAFYAFSELKRPWADFLRPQQVLGL